MNFVPGDIFYRNVRFLRIAKNRRFCKVFFVCDPQKYVYLPITVIYKITLNILLGNERARQKRKILDGYAITIIFYRLQPSLICLVSIVSVKFSQSRYLTLDSKFARHTRLDKACYITCRDSRIQSLLRRTCDLFFTNPASLPHSILFERRIGRPYLYRLSIEPIGEIFFIFHHYAN